MFCDQFQFFLSVRNCILACSILFLHHVTSYLKWFIPLLSGCLHLSVSNNLRLVFIGVGWGERQYSRWVGWVHTYKVREGRRSLEVM